MSAEQETQIRERLANTEEVARRIFCAVWHDADTARHNWDAALPAQRAYWLKAAENVAAYVMTGTSPEGGDVTPLERVVAAAKGEVNQPTEAWCRHCGNSTQHGIDAAGCFAELVRRGEDMTVSEMGELLALEGHNVTVEGPMVTVHPTQPIGGVTLTAANPGKPGDVLP